MPNTYYYDYDIYHRHPYDRPYSFMDDYYTAFFIFIFIVFLLFICLQAVMTYPSASWYTNEASPNYGSVRSSTGQQRRYTDYV